MPKHRTKRVVLHRTDHRIEIGPAGRNLFVSRDKQIQSRQARHIKLWMRFVMALGVLVIAAGVGLFVMLYLVPYFQHEILLSHSDTSQGEDYITGSQVTIPTYDSMGLPVYPNEVSLFVINRDEPADASYVPNTVEAAGVQVEAHVANALNQMVTAAAADGITLTFTEGYISYEEQQTRYDAKVEELMSEGYTTVMARTQARSLAPRAGECDQQTGMCLRLAGDPETFEESSVCSWLRTNMGKYGFVFRYPDDKEEYTGCEADPTVIRYVGSENATAMQQRSMCLEEYLSYLANQG